MEGFGRGRGRGRKVVLLGEGTTEEPEAVGASSSLIRVGRGRGRGIPTIPAFVPTQSEPSVGHLRRLERPVATSDTEDEEDDFISGFRKLTAGSSSASASGSLSQLKPFHSEGISSSGSSSSVMAPRGRGRGRGLIAGIVDIPVLQNFPREPEAVLVRHVQNISPLSSKSTSSRTSSVISTEETSTSETEKQVVVKRGEQGRKVALCANFVKLRRLGDEETGLCEYHVFFDPEIEAKRLRHNIMRNCSNHIGSIMNFDGVKLYLPIKLGDKITHIQCYHPTNSNILVNVSIKFVKKSSLDSSVQFYNILFRKIMNILGMVEMNRNFFDYDKIYDLPIHKLQIWPGYVTAVDVFEGGLMLCCDSSFRVLRTDTMLDALIRFYDANPTKHQELFRNYALRKVILTRYNNKHYRIDDVDWTRTPKSTFVQCRNGVEQEVTDFYWVPIAPNQFLTMCSAFKHLPKNFKKFRGRSGTEIGWPEQKYGWISFVDYYQNCHNVTIKDHNQPMLVSRGKIKSQSNEPAPSVILLVPELCYVTGMTEEITSDFRIMKDIAQQTRISPMQRHNALLDFVQNVNENPKAQSVLKDWGLELDSVTVQVEGRVLTPPTIILNKNMHMKPSIVGDFSRDVTKNTIYDPVHVTDWLLVCMSNEELKARNLMRMYRMVAPPLGIKYRGDGRVAYVGGKGRPEDYRRTLIENIEPNVTQFVVVIIPSSRQDLYQVIKVICNREVPIPSQVVLSKTLGDERRLRSIMQKVALQINCKLGGALWTLNIPLPEKIMFVGMDVYHDPARKNPSVTGVVATISLTYTKYYSRVIFQSPQQESVASLRPVIIDCMKEFFKENQAFPDRIILFRDGVGDGQLELAKNTEVAQILEGCKYLDAKPKFTFCVVQKRINARMFVQEGAEFYNPEPGTVLDHTVTRRYLFDFFLVSQLIREGTVNPTHYIVLYDDAEIKPDVMQKFAYATSYMYYNWAGSIRVPAMCQYAHKLAGLVGQHLRTEPSPELSKKLYYL